jgi:hypothetical protein
MFCDKCGRIFLSPAGEKGEERKLKPWQCLEHEGKHLFCKRCFQVLLNEEEDLTSSINQLYLQVWSWCPLSNKFH